MDLKKRTKILLLVLVAVLICIAAALNYDTENLGPRAEICNRLSEYGYSLEFDDIFVSGESERTSIRALLSEVDLTAAVEASLQAGFPSDIDTVGEVVVLLAALDEERVITIYTLDGEMQLCFIQTLDSYEVEPL